jgi:nucleoside-diphosphate-sugar epimerase
MKGLNFSMNIFITGATGFLGTELVKKLVGYNHHVYLLVRNAKKVEDLLQCLDDEKKQLVHIINGELTKEHLGMDEEILKGLIGKMDVIYHTAAYLSFDESEREEIFRINVTGTRNILQFASKIQTKKFIHVSTAYTLGARTEGEESLYSLDSTFVNSYEESKCHAEHLVMSYQDQFHVSIMRPSIIIGDSETGEANTSFGLYGIMRSVELLKKRSMKKNESNQIYRLLIEKDEITNIVPVDYVVNVLFLALEWGREKTVYHITNSNPPTNEAVFNIIKDVYAFNAIELMPYKDEKLLFPQELNLNKPLAVFKEYLNRSITFSNENTKELLSQGNKTELKMDTDMIYRIVLGFKNRPGARHPSKFLVSQFVSQAQPNEKDEQV